VLVGVVVPPVLGVAQEQPLPPVVHLLPLLHAQPSKQPIEGCPVLAVLLDSQRVLPQQVLPDEGAGELPLHVFGGRHGGTDDELEGLHRPLPPLLVDFLARLQGLLRNDQGVDVFHLDGLPKGVIELKDPHLQLGFDALHEGFHVLYPNAPGLEDGLKLLLGQQRLPSDSDDHAFSG
jgi:hypothetical protein